MLLLLLDYSRMMGPTRTVLREPDTSAAAIIQPFGPCRCLPTVCEQCVRSGGHGGKRAPGLVLGLVELPLPEGVSPDVLLDHHVGSPGVGV